MYQLTKEEEKRRVYRSEVTGTEIITTLIHSDPDGKRYWAFEDLLNIPFIRKKAAEKVTNLYEAGVTLNDLTTFINTMKDLVRSNDSEKYEKSYSEVLQFEALMKETVDPVRQCLSLCTVYVLDDDEPIDIYSSAKAFHKMENWSLQPEIQAFFLQWFTDGMNAYTKVYGELTQIASRQEK
ncbi:MAG: hypothetical protein WKF88_05710 [Ferruginibacter sp.]